MHTGVQYKKSNVRYLIIIYFVLNICWSDIIFDIQGYLKYIIKINFSLVFFAAAKPLENLKLCVWLALSYVCH